MPKAKLENLVIPEKNLTCAAHAYKGVYVLSREPLVLYIEGFVSEEEGKEVVALRYVFLVLHFSIVIWKELCSLWKSSWVREIIYSILTKNKQSVITSITSLCLETNRSHHNNPHFTPSTVWTSGTESFKPSIRNSEKAPLPRSQTVKCIEERARVFQGWRPYTFIEKLWSQRYGVGGHYTYHYDWSTATKKSGRVSSFMVYLEANCTGGGTHFPRLERPQDEHWCRFIECGHEASSRDAGLSTGATEDGRHREDLSKGVIFKPITGNAVFWENMRSDGSGYAESWHAGLPVTKGVKIGLNIWSWLAEGYVPAEGDA
ncbi:prolyl 4-hydroxylase [Alternaria panax]|uniref:Prolyl 4-hydroxylase n=1 Tax=Alternaria panax TaxID=48097 RepID=A0AAD4IKR7_9PLEO|nr:prolyl 4-hydroxylase [Alternaria panax]